MLLRSFILDSLKFPRFPHFSSSLTRIFPSPNFSFFSSTASASASSSSSSSSFSRSSNQGFPDYYALLGVSRDSSAADLKESYFKLAKQFHPDVYVRVEEKFQKWAERRFAAIGVAYSILSDPVKRQHYDTFFDLTAIGDRDRMLHWLAIHRPPERIEYKPD